MTLADSIEGSLPQDTFPEDSTAVRAVVLVISLVILFIIVRFFKFREQWLAGLLSLLIVVVFVCCVIYLASIPPLVPVVAGDDTTAAQVHPGIYVPGPTTLALFIFSYTCQMNVFYVYSELLPAKTRVNGSGGREAAVPLSLSLLSSAAFFVNWLAILVPLALYVFTGVYGVIAFGQQAASSVLNNLLLGSPMGTALRVLVGLKMLLTFPLMVYPLLDSTQGVWKHLPAGRTLAIVVTLLAVGAIATFVRNLSFVLSLVGAVSEVYLSFVLPPLLLLKNGGWGREGLLFRVVCVCLLIMGPVISVLAIVGLCLGWQ